MTEKTYTFKRADNSGIAFDIEAAAGSQQFANLTAFDAEGNDLVVGAFDLEYALDCFNAIVMQQQPKGETNP